jgi:D-alanyl-D-alanine carboxypeptidase
MTKIIGTIISFILSLVAISHTATLPQDEQRQENDKSQNNITIDIENINIEELEPEKSTNSSITSTNNWWEYPSNIKETIRNGNDLLVLVNKRYKLPSTYAPDDLTKVGEEVIRRGSNYYLRSILINDLQELVDEAKSVDIDLSIVSAYRSYQTQANTYQYWVNYNDGCVSCADRISARAGHSQHQLGTTLDFSSNEINDDLGISFGDSKASDWLQTNAYKYGFVLSFPQGYESVTGFSYEPWHYRYIGKENALEMHNRGMILEYFLQSKN